jgi:hypothetical protein
LGFGAAYKILDLLVEHVLRANGSAAVRTFSQKSRALGVRPRNLPVPLDDRPGLWDRIAATYVAFQRPGTPSLTGRPKLRLPVTWRFTTTAAYWWKGSAALSSPAFAAAVHALAEAVIDEDRDPRRLNLAAWQLNALGVRHGLSSLAATDPDAGRRLLRTELTELDSGLVHFNVARAREIVSGQPPGVRDFELPAGRRDFVGRWEDVPDGDDGIDFHPASPPPWLSEQVA